MTPEQSLKNEVIKAGKARDFLENDLFKEAFSEVEQALLAGIRQSAFKDAELREKLCQQYTLLHSLRDRFQTYIETGQLAEEEIRRKSISEKVKEFLHV